MLTTWPVAEAIARGCGTHHHLTRTFAQVCRAWRDAAREEECNRLDAALERVRRQYLIPFWRKQREMPFRRANIGFSCNCDNCGIDLDFHNVWWHAIDHPSRGFDLCSTCHAAYRGQYRFVDLAHDENGPYFICGTRPRDYYGSLQMIVIPMRVPPQLRWPRTLYGVERAQLLRAAEAVYHPEDYFCCALPTFTMMSSFSDRRCWIDTDTDTLQVENVVTAASDVLINKPVSELERDPSFNILDWVPIAASRSREYAFRRTVFQHVVCANPSNTRFYGCRAVIVNGAWTLWSKADNNTARLERTCSTTLNEAGWNAEPDESDRAIENRIRQRAYEIWQSTQRNDDMANWLQAKREIYDGVDVSLAPL